MLVAWHVNFQSYTSTPQGVPWLHGYQKCSKVNKDNLNDLSKATETTKLK